MQGVSYTAATEPNRVIMPDDVADEDYVYLLKDLYTVAGLANERGWPVERYDYDAYGQVQMSRCAILPYAADFDGDGDVDDDDLAILKQCYKGSGNEPDSYGGLGWIADLDGDGDVDGSDYVQFVYAYNGSGNPPRGAATPSVSLGSMAASRVGNPYFLTGRRLDVLDISDNGTPRRFTDDVAGLTIYDFRARRMDPVLGRFYQIDPLRYAYGMNPFEYVRSRPTQFLDPFGLATLGEWGDWVATSMWGWLGDSYLSTMTDGEMYAIAIVPSVAGGAAVAAYFYFAGTAAVVTGIGAGTATVATTLTPQQQRAIQSLLTRIAEHQQKIANYIRNPEAFDNLGFLKNAPTPEIRQRIIDGRIQHLLREIEAFEGSIEKIKNCR